MPVVRRLVPRRVLDVDHGVHDRVVSTGGAGPARGGGPSHGQAGGNGSATSSAAETLRGDEPQWFRDSMVEESAPVAPGAAQRTASLARAALPARIKAGRFSPQGMVLETAGGSVEVPWGDVELLCVGVLEESVGSPREARSPMRNMVRQVFFGENRRDEEKIRKVRDVWILDVYVAGQAVPYRFDASSVNYRSFFGEVSYMSHQNFLRLVASVAHECRESRLNGSATALLLRQKERVKHYASIQDFELESSQCRHRLSHQIPRAEIRIEERLFAPRIPPVSDDDAGLESDPFA